MADVVGWGPLALNSTPGLALAVMSQAIQAAAGIQQSRNCTPDVFVVAGRSRGGMERRGSGQHLQHWLLGTGSGLSCWSWKEYWGGDNVSGTVDMAHSGKPTALDFVQPWSRTERQRR